MQLATEAHGKTRKEIVRPETVPCPFVRFRGRAPKTSAKRGQSPFIKCNWPRKHTEAHGRTRKEIVCPETVSCPSVCFRGRVLKTASQKGVRALLLSAIGHGSTRKTRKKIVWPESVPCPSVCFRGGVLKTIPKALKGSEPFFFCMVSGF